MYKTALAPINISLTVQFRFQPYCWSPSS